MDVADCPNTSWTMADQLPAEETSKALELARDLKTKVSDVITHVQCQLKRVQQGEWNTSKGISFLEVKYQMLLSYLINLTYLMWVKVRGHSIKDNDAIERLVEIRTVLEKMRPIDQKLKYQIDKVLKTAATGTLDQNDPLRYKPNPDNLQNKFEEENGESSDESDEGMSGSKVYKPPKLAAVYYDGDDTLKIRKEKKLQQAKKRALSSSVIRELKEEYYDGPEEIKETADLHRMKEDKAGKERIEYEEKYLVRTAVSKKEKNTAKKLRTGLDNIMKFGDISALIDEQPDLVDDTTPAKKRKRSSLKGKKKGKGSKKHKRRK